MDYNVFLGDYKNISLNVKKYYDFIEHKPPFIKGLDEFNIPYKFFNYVKICMNDSSVYIDTTQLIKHLAKKYNLNDQTTFSEARNIIRHYKLTDTNDLLKKYPELKPLYYQWFEENKNSYDDELNLLKLYHYHMLSERKDIYRKMPDASEEKKEKYKEKLEYIDENTKKRLSGKIQAFFIKKFISEIETEITYYFKYKENRYIPVPYIKNLIVNNDLFHYYLTRMIFNTTKKNELSKDNKILIKNYLLNFIDDKYDKLDYDGNVIITYKNFHGQKITKAYSISDILDYLDELTLERDLS